MTRGCAGRNRKTAAWVAGLRSLPAEMPTRCILEMSVILDNPSFAAAPSQPPSTQFVASKVATMWSRSTCASARAPPHLYLVRPINYARLSPHCGASMAKKPDLHFPSTNWSEIREWNSLDPAGQRVFLSTFYARYRRPLLAYVTRAYPDADAEDVLHDFVVAQISGSVFAAADWRKGRFRDLLLKTLRNFLISRFRHANARRRSPREGFVSIDEVQDSSLADPHGVTPESAFEREWRRTVVRNALEAVQLECKQKGMSEHFDLFNRRIVAPILDGASRPSVEELARSSNTTARAISNRIVTMKRMFDRALEAEVARIPCSALYAQEELRDVKSTVYG